MRQQPLCGGDFMTPAPLLGRELTFDPDSSPASPIAPVTRVKPDLVGETLCVSVKWARTSAFVLFPTPAWSL
jgi:hypothetical protein